jgi:hypothetical protein
LGFCKAITPHSKKNEEITGMIVLEKENLTDFIEELFGIR